MALHRITISHPDQKIKGIKALRSITGLGLKEAKDAYESATGGDSRKDATLMLDLPYTASQRHIVQAGCKALGFNVEVGELLSRPNDTGYWSVHFKTGPTREIEVFKLGGRWLYRESGQHFYLDELDSLTGQTDPDYRPHFAHSSRKAFNEYSGF